jgi:hypothetical protein
LKDPGPVKVEKMAESPEFRKKPQNCKSLKMACIRVIVDYKKQLQGQVEKEYKCKENNIDLPWIPPKK